MTEFVDLKIVNHAEKRGRDLDYYKRLALNSEDQSRRNGLPIGWPRIERLTLGADILVKACKLLLTIDYVRNVHGEVVERSDNSGYGEDTRAVISDMVTLADSADLHGMTIGEVDDQRALHVWLNGHQYEPANVAGAPDWFVSQASTLVKKRSNSGLTSVKVTRAGRSWTIGNATSYVRAIGPHIDQLRTCTIDRDKRNRNALHGVRRSSSGAYDGIDLVRLTDALYDLPALIGGETTSHHKVWSEEVSDLVRDGCYVMGDGSIGTGPIYDYAAHRTATADQKKSTSGLTYQDRTLKALEPRADERRAMANGQMLAPADNAVVIRTPIAGTVERDERGRIVYRIPDRIALSIGTVESATAFVGHQLVVRPATVHDERHKRGAPRKVTSGHQLNAETSNGMQLATIAERLERDSRANWRDCNGQTGTISVSAGGLFSVRLTVNGVQVWRVRARTIANLRLGVDQH